MKVKKSHQKEVKVRVEKAQCLNQTIRIPKEVYSKYKYARAFLPRVSWPGLRRIRVATGADPVEPSMYIGMQGYEGLEVHV